VREQMATRAHGARARSRARATRGAGVQRTEAKQRQLEQRAIADDRLPGADVLRARERGRAVCANNQSAVKEVRRRSRSARLANVQQATWAGRRTFIMQQAISPSKTCSARARARGDRGRERAQW
jgi:hypothetical protein